MNENTFVEQWKEFDRKEYADLYRLTFTQSLLAPIFAAYDEDDIFDYSIIENVCADRLQEIESHKQFKMFMAEPHFAEMYVWLDSSRAPPEYGYSEDKIKILNCFFASFSGYAWRVGMKAPTDPKIVTDKIEALNRKARNLVKEIEKSKDYLDPTFSIFLSSTLPLVEYIETYAPVRPLKYDDTYLERTFLYHLVGMMREQELHVSISFLKRALRMTYDVSLVDDEANLRKHVKALGKKYMERKAQSQKMKGLLKTRA